MKHTVLFPEVKNAAMENLNKTIRRYVPKSAFHPKYRTDKRAWEVTVELTNEEDRKKVALIRNSIRNFNI